ncbi:MAG: hypothetical protein ACTSQY_03365 [Candidatus Odinarchaeia archaeon]
MNKENRVELISIFDISGNILISYPDEKREKELFKIIRNNFKKPSYSGKLIHYDADSYKLWFKRQNGLVFSLMTDKDIPEQVGRHILNLIIKPFMQGFEEDLKKYKELKEKFHLFIDILKVCRYTEFINWLVTELTLKK